MIDEDPNAQQYLIPIIQGKTDLNSWSSRNNLSFLVKVESSENFNHPWSGKSQIEALRIFKETTPAVSSWLLRFEENLKNRSDQGAFFWELRSCTYWGEFAKDKVIIPTLSKEPVAVLDKNGFTCNDKTTVCICSKPLLLASLMHCDLIWWQLTRIAAIRQNSYFEIKDMYLSDLLFPILTKDEADFFEMHGSECINKEKKGLDIYHHKTAINKKLSEIWHISDDQLLVVSNALRGNFLELI
jgi:hypothetical protein